MVGRPFTAAAAAAGGERRVTAHSARSGWRRNLTNRGRVDHRRHARPQPEDPRGWSRRSRSPYCCASRSPPPRRITRFGNGAPTGSVAARTGRFPSAGNGSPIIRPTAGSIVAPASEPYDRPPAGPRNLRPRPTPSYDQNSLEIDDGGVSSPTTTPIGGEGRQPSGRGRTKNYASSPTTVRNTPPTPARSPIEPAGR